MSSSNRDDKSCPCSLKQERESRNLAPVPRHALKAKGNREIMASREVAQLCVLLYKLDVNY